MSQFHDYFPAFSNLHYLAPHCPSLFVQPHASTPPSFWLTSLCLIFCPFEQRLAQQHMLFVYKEPLTLNVVLMTDQRLVPQHCQWTFTTMTMMVTTMTISPPMLPYPVPAGLGRGATSAGRGSHGMYRCGSAMGAGCGEIGGDNGGH
jgi:hypothetical protein